MRDLLVFAIVMVLLPMGFRRPYIGLLLFSWLAYMRPQDLCWGFARSMRFSFLVGLVMIVGWFVHESGGRQFFRRDGRTTAMIALAVVTTISLALARVNIDSEYVMRYYFEFVKIIAIALFTTGQVDSKSRLRTLLWTICLCLAFYGVKNGLLGILTGGRPILRGPGGMLEDNNDFALAMVMNIPLLFYLGASEHKVWITRASRVGIALTMVTILLTHSRGGFLAAAATLLYMTWRSRKLPQALAMLALAGAAFVLFAPDHVMERVASIGEGGKEASAGARLRAWAAALRMIEANPIWGVGLRNFQHNFGGFAADWDPSERLVYVAHNSYLQVWAEGGTISLALYMGLLFSVFFGAWRLSYVARSRPDLEWLGHYARMFEATAAGFMVGATFLNRGHFDLIYHWFALMSALVLVTRQALRHSASLAAVPAADRGIEVRWRREVGPSMLPRWGR